MCRLQISLLKRLVAIHKVTVSIPQSPLLSALQESAAGALSEKLGLCHAQMALIDSRLASAAPTADGGNQAAPSSPPAPQLERDDMETYSPTMDPPGGCPQLYLKLFNEASMGKSVVCELLVPSKMACLPPDQRLFMEPRCWCRCMHWKVSTSSCRCYLLA